MDPLSVTASAIAIATLAANTCRAFTDLRSLCKQLPGRLHALNNEVVDIQVVLHQVASIFNERACAPIPQGQQVAIPALLDQAKTKLSEVQEIVEQLYRSCDHAKFVVLQARAWRREQPKLQELQNDIKIIKCNLNVLLGASNSYDPIRSHTHHNF
jgi:hypothetical protein